MELIGLDIVLGLKGERIKEDSGFLWSTYQGRNPRGNTGVGGGMKVSTLKESGVHYEIRSRVGGLAWADSAAEGGVPCSEHVE